MGVEENDDKPINPLPLQPKVPEAEIKEMNKML